MSTSLQTSIECVLFDLDGTLVDTAADFVCVVNALLDENGESAIPGALIAQSVSDGARALIKLAFEINEGQPQFDDLHQRLLELYYQKLLQTEATIYPGLELLLAQFKLNNIPWGIVTNKPEKYSQRLLEQLGLSQDCAALICPDHVTNRKPNPESILLACQQIGCDTARTVYIGDHIRDMQAAKNADVIAIAASYGYLHPDARVEEWHADFILTAPENTESLLNLLKFT